MRLPCGRSNPLPHGRGSEKARREVFQNRDRQGVEHDSDFPVFGGFTPAICTYPIHVTEIGPSHARGYRS